MNKIISTPPPVGENLKHERQKRKMSLGALAEISGVSKAMLSQIEANKVNPTLATLWKASQALEIDITQIIGGKSVKPERFSVLTVEQQAIVSSDDGNTNFKLLTAPEMPTGLELYQIVMNGFAKHTSKPHATNCNEFLTVIKGKIKVTAGERHAILNDNDFIAYQGDLPHSIENLTETPAMLHLITLTTKN